MLAAIALHLRNKIKSHKGLTIGNNHASSDDILSISSSSSSSDSSPSDEVSDVSFPSLCTSFPFNDFASFWPFFHFLCENRHLLEQEPYLKSSKSVQQCEAWPGMLQAQRVCQTHYSLSRGWFPRLERIKGQIVLTGSEP